MQQQKFRPMQPLKGTGKHRAPRNRRRRTTTQRVASVVTSLSFVLGSLVSVAPTAQASADICYQPTGVAKTYCDTRDAVVAAGLKCATMEPGTLCPTAIQKAKDELAVAEQIVQNERNWIAQEAEYYDCTRYNPSPECQTILGVVRSVGTVVSQCTGMYPDTLCPKTVALVMEEVQALVGVVLGTTSKCLSGETGACQTVLDEYAAANAAVQKCINMTPGTLCPATIQLVKDEAAWLLATVENQTGPLTITGPEGTPLGLYLDPSSADIVLEDEGVSEVGAGVGQASPVAGSVSTPGVVSRQFDTPTDALTAGDPAAQGDAGSYNGSCNPTGDVTYQYTPVPIKKYDQGINQNYLIIPYQRNYAHYRPDTAQYTYQVALCSFGGAKTYHHWRLLREGIGTTLWPTNSPSSQVKIAQDWDTTADGQSTGSVTFQVSTGPASVGASIPTGSDGYQKGDASDQGPYQPDSVCRLSCVNDVHAWWDNHSPFWVPPSDKGVTSFRGTVELGLYELGMDTQGSFHWWAQGFYRRQCDRGGGNCPT